MKLDIIGMADIKEQEEARVNLKERWTMTLSLSQWTKEPLWEKGTKGIYRQHNDKILQMPACTEQKNIRYHQTKTNPSPKCGFLDKIMETWGIHINGHLNAKTIWFKFGRSVFKIMFLYTSVPIVHIFSAERVQHRLHTVAVLSCPVVAMLLHCALDLLCTWSSPVCQNRNPSTWFSLSAGGWRQSKANLVNRGRVGVEQRCRCRGHKTPVFSVCSEVVSHECHSYMLTSVLLL